MHAMVKPFKNGRSLLSLGFHRVGLDDAWQACGTGYNGTFHDANGKPLVNLTRFPNMKDMTALGHSLGLKVEWYLNNCDCAEHGFAPSMAAKHYQGDVDALVSYGYDGAKFDACGQFNNLSTWVRVIQQQENRTHERNISSFHTHMHCIALHCICL